MTPQGEILEATTVKKGNLEDKPVRTVGLNKFRKDTAKIIVFRRKTPMTDIQREEFDKAATKSALRTYAKEQAFFSNGLPTIKFLLALYFGIPCIEIILYLMMNNSQGGVLTIALQFIGGLILSWIIIYFLLDRAFSSQWGKQKIQELYSKRKLGKKLVDRENNDMFCSKLVAIFDELSGGVLCQELNSLNDARPIDVVKAARQKYYVKYQEEGPIKSQKWWSYVFFWLRY